MTIREWFEKRRRQKDAEALRREEDLAGETPQERAASSGDITGLAADERMGRIAGQTQSDVDRLGY